MGGTYIQPLFVRRFDPPGGRSPAGKDQRADVVAVDDRQLQIAVKRRRHSNWSPAVVIIWWSSHRGTTATISSDSDNFVGGATSTLICVNACAAGHYYGHDQAADTPSKLKF